LPVAFAGVGVASQLSDGGVVPLLVPVVAVPLVDVPVVAVPLVAVPLVAVPVVLPVVPTEVPVVDVPLAPVVPALPVAVPLELPSPDDPLPKLVVGAGELEHAAKEKNAAKAEGIVWGRIRTVPLEKNVGARAQRTSGSL
jgi:hypothetical protein